MYPQRSWGLDGRLLHKLLNYLPKSQINGLKLLPRKSSRTLEPKDYVTMDKKFQLDNVAPWSRSRGQKAYALFFH